MCGLLSADRVQTRRFFAKFSRLFLRFSIANKPPALFQSLLIAASHSVKAREEPWTIRICSLSSSNKFKEMYLKHVSKEVWPQNLFSATFQLLTLWDQVTMTSRKWESHSVPPGSFGKSKIGTASCLEDLTCLIFRMWLWLKYLSSYRNFSPHLIWICKIFSLWSNSFLSARKKLQKLFYAHRSQLPKKTLPPPAYFFPGG